MSLFYPPQSTLLTSQQALPTHLSVHLHTSKSPLTQHMTPSYPTHIAFSTQFTGPSIQTWGPILYYSPQEQSPPQRSVCANHNKFSLHNSESLFYLLQRPSLYTSVILTSIRKYCDSHHRALIHTSFSPPACLQVTYVHPSENAYFIPQSHLPIQLRMPSFFTSKTLLMHLKVQSKHNLEMLPPYLFKQSLNTSEIPPYTLLSPT